MRVRSFAYLFLILLAACTPRIDSSTGKKMNASVAKVKADLPADKREEFQKALAIVLMSDLTLGSMLGEGLDMEEIVYQGKKKLHGKTGEEVIALAAKIWKERKKARSLAKRSRSGQGAKIEKRHDDN